MLQLCDQDWEWKAVKAWVAANALQPCWNVCSDFQTTARGLSCGWCRITMSTAPFLITWTDTLLRWKGWSNWLCPLQAVLPIFTWRSSVPKVTLPTVLLFKCKFLRLSYLLKTQSLTGNVLNFACFFKENLRNMEIYLEINKQLFHLNFLVVRFMLSENLNRIHPFWHSDCLRLVAA